MTHQLQLSLADVALQSLTKVNQKSDFVGKLR
jgi:hypothetical protein